MPKSGTLAKAHTIDAVAESNGYTLKKSIETVETVLELIKRSLESWRRCVDLRFWKIQRNTIISASNVVDSDAKFESNLILNQLISQLALILIDFQYIENRR